MRERRWARDRSRLLIERRTQGRAAELAELHPRRVDSPTPAADGRALLRCRAGRGTGLGRSLGWGRVRVQGSGRRWLGGVLVGDHAILTRRGRQRCSTARAETVRRRVRCPAARARNWTDRSGGRSRGKLEVGRCRARRSACVCRGSAALPRQAISAIPAKDEVRRIVRAAPIAPHETRGPRVVQRVKGTFSRNMFPCEGLPRRPYHRGSGLRTSNTSSIPTRCATPNPKTSSARS